MKRDWMIKVFFIAKIKNFNNEYYDYSKRVREKAETMPGFIDLISEEKDDVEITISSWKTMEDVDAWRKDYFGALFPLNPSSIIPKGEDITKTINN